MTEPQSVSQNQCVGAALARTREELGLKLDDVALALKLTTARVAAIESGQFATVGAAIYVRGFVRSYSKLLGLPSRGFDAQLQEYFDQREPELVPSHGTRRSVNWGERYSWAFSYLVGTALVLTLIWTVIGFDSDSQKRSLVDESVTKEEISAEQIAAMAGDVDSDDSMTADSVFEGNLESALQTVPDPVAVQPRTPAGSNPAQSPVMASLSPFRTEQISAERGFVLNLSGQSWTEVLDANGGRIAYGTLNVGTHRIEGQPPFTVLLGNAGAAQLSAAGQAIDVSPFMRANVARFKLEASDGVLRPAEAAPR